VGSLLFPYVSQLYPPLDLDLMLVFFGLLFFVALTVAFFLERRARKRQELEILKRIYSGFIPLPWLLAAALLLNGKFDNPKNIVYHPTVVENRFYMKDCCGGVDDCLWMAGGWGRKLSDCRWMRMISTGFRMAMRWWWAWSRGCWGSRGITGCTGGELRLKCANIRGAKLIERFSVWAEGDLKFDKGAFRQAEA